VVSLPALQRVTERPDKINFVNLRVRAGLDSAALAALKATLEGTLPGLRVFSSGEIARENPATRLARVMSWATTALAVALGGLGITNTILMSVFERTHEIGILLAVGWRRSRLLAMVLAESVLLSVVGGVLGVVLGAIALRVIVTSPGTGGRLTAPVTAETVLLALALSVILGALGGLYPALRACLMSPAKAMEAS
jgi:putative ABC transport system permease protein